MKEKLRVAQYGTGKMSVYTMRYVFEKGCEIVCAFDINPSIIGKDIGEIMGTENKGITISDATDAESILSNLKPDICIITTMSLLNDVKDALLLCAKLGINAITTCEEAFYSYNSNPTLSNQINELAISNNCTITGSGYQDIYWGELISAIAASSHKISKIKGSSSYNIEDYGIALAEAHGAGLTIEEFNKRIAVTDEISNSDRQNIINSGKYNPSYMWNVNGWIAHKLGLTINNQTQKCIPTTYKDDIYSSTLNMTVKKGDSTGMNAVVTTITEEGITIESECIGKIYGPDEFDKNEWSIIGEPNTTITINRPSTVELTCATIVNRLPDVINAKSGFIPTCEMEELFYRNRPLIEYIK